MTTLAALLALGQTPAPTPVDPVQEVVRITNEFRVAKRRSELKWNAQLQRAAQLHAQDMVEMEYFSHRSLNGDELKNRIDRQGYAWLSIGENLARGQADAAEVVKAWQGSPGHRRNLLDPDFTEVGVALVRDPQIRTMWVMVFAAPQ